jgi:hypothetical protein
MLLERNGDTLHCQGLIRDKLFIMTITRPDTAPQQPEKKPYVLQMASRETLPVLKEVWVELPLGQCAVHIWGFVAKITGEYILRLDIL